MTESKAKFDPNDHLINLKGKDYLEVKWRLVWFREDHPKAHITATPVHITDTSAVFQAKVELDDGTTVVAHGSETQKDFRDFLEKAETKAVGRALAWLGYGTQFAPELDEGERLADAPIERGRGRNPDPTPWEQQPAPPSRGSTKTNASDKQLNFIRGLWKELGYVAVGDDGKEHHDAASLDMYCTDNWQTPLANMTKEQAGQVLDALQALKADRQGGEHVSYNDQFVNQQTGEIVPF